MFVVDEYYCSETTTAQTYLGCSPSQSSQAYTVLMRANQPETAVRYLLGLLCTHLFPCKADELLNIGTCTCSVLAKLS